MKIQDVPQDNDPTYEGKTKLCYATDEAGKFVAVQTRGWEVESTVKNYAWEIINNELADLRSKLGRDEISSLRYFMKFRLMDEALLANNMNISRLRLWWHLKPSVFEKMNDRWLKKYSECLDVSIERLKNYRGD